MKEPLSVATKTTRGSKLKKRIAYRTCQRSSTRERNREQQVLVEVSSDSLDTDGVLTTNEESFNEMVEMHAKTKGKGGCEGAESSEVCNYLIGAGDSTDSDESYRKTVTEIGGDDRSGREGNYKLPEVKGSSKHETGDKTPGDVTCYYGAPPVSQTGKGLLDDMELCHSPIARLNVEGRQMIEYMSEGGRAYRNYDSSGQSSYVDLQTAQLETDQGSQHTAHGEDENNMYEFCPTPISVRKNTHTEIV